MYNETHGLFFIDYLLGTKIQLHTRNSIYAFSRLPDPWAQGIHKISLAANDFRQARHLPNPIKVALKKALHRTAGYESVAFSSMATGSRNLTQLEALAVTTDLAGEAIVLEITEHRSGQINIDLTGPVAKLDWSIIPLMRYTRTLPGWQSFHVARVQRNAFKRAENVIKEAGNSYRVIVLNGDPEDEDIEDLGVFGFVHDAERELRVCLSRPEDMDSEMRVWARQIKMMEREILYFKSMSGGAPAERHIMWFSKDL